MAHRVFSNITICGLTAVLLVFGLNPASAPAQHPIDVERAASQSQYFKALSLYQKMPARIITTSAAWAAAKSAWALGLHERALQEFDRVLQDEALDVVRKARVYLSKGIIAFQDDRVQLATMYAEEGVNILKDRFKQPESLSPLRGRLYLLWAEALYGQESFGAAEEKYLLALEQLTIDERSEANFLLGRCRFRLDKFEQARKNFELVPLDHARTAETIRYLAQISIKQEAYENATFWLEKGREEYAEQFLDSWVDYALMQSAIARKDQQQVKKIRSNAEQKYPAVDAWLTLLQAAAEAFEWQKYGNRLQ